MLGKDLDGIILLELNDQDLGKICSLSTRFRKICKDDNFWRKRTVKRFERYLGGLEEIKKYKNPQETWRNYYIYLVDYIEKMYKKIHWELSKFEREGMNEDLWNRYFLEKYPGDKYKSNLGDLKILERIYYENNKKIEKAENWKEMINRELINPNIIIGKGKEAIKYLINSKDRRVNLSYEDNTALSNMTFEDIDQEIINLILKDKRVDPNVALTAILIGKKIDNILTDDRITKEGLANSMIETVYEQGKEVDKNVMIEFIRLIKEKGGTKEYLEGILKEMYELNYDKIFNKSITILEDYLENLI